MRRLLTLLLPVLLAGSACTRHVPLHATTTVVQRDTVLVRPAVQADTQAVLRPRDTLHLVRERLRVRVVRHRDTLRLEARCAPDTLRIPVTRTVVRQAVAPQSATRAWPWVLLGALASAAVLGGLRRLLPR